ncbi:uncharacterized protein K452DRAFT_304117 [Aplosporella prunicola CBS 121167]|uniref:Elongin-A n=1 Tax=Aplosporella prunicola CBS 121167 TaxID=1176127 RepID=A0A6A6BV91_9PEZI|nr:uncharacterized protein K452DRAFT_304117 [Aplosporella prunicola CBS 121167]KAF2147243.1 hypothetical protein K452DRAFT_304117 [Aplosporella prunicola CBS 121167]
MPASSLFEMAKRRVIRNIHLLTDVGDELPYRILEPILKKIENPSQLREIEKNSPHLAEDTGELWLAFIKRDIQNWEDRAHVPRNPSSWAKVYAKLKRDQEAEIEQQQRALKDALKKKELERKKNTSTLLNRNFADPRRAKGGWGSSSSSTQAAQVARDPRNFTYRPGEKKKTLTGKGIIAKIQHQAADHRSQQRLAQGNARALTHSSLGKVTVAPKSMAPEPSRMPVDNGRRVGGPVTGLAAVGGDRFLQERREAIKKKEDAAKERDRLRDREARLKALASGHKLPPRDGSPAEGPSFSSSSRGREAGAGGLPARKAPPLGSSRRSPSPPGGRSANKRKRDANVFMAPRKK